MLILRLLQAMRRNAVSHSQPDWMTELCPQCLSSRQRKARVHIIYKNNNNS